MCVIINLFNLNDQLKKTKYCYQGQYRRSLSIFNIKREKAKHKIMIYQINAFLNSFHIYLLRDQYFNEGFSYRRLNFIITMIVIINWCMLHSVHIMCSKAVNNT